MLKTGRRKQRLAKAAKAHANRDKQGPSLNDEKRWFHDPRLLTGLVLLILLAFGTYKAWTLYGAYPVPNPDFPGFIGIGRTLLRFEIPNDFRRAPMVGVFQVLISKLLDTDSPELSAGWLLNAVLSVANILLLWQVARHFIGKAAAFLAVVAMLNPWVLRSQVNPIAETAMIFFILSSFYCMFRRSHWVYLFASIAALVRYECSALIFIAFVMDMILRKGLRQRLIAFGYSAIASIPFLLWMLGTYLKWGEGTGGAKSHYIKNLMPGHNRVGMEFIRLLWEAAFGVLTAWPAYIQAVFPADTLTRINQSLAVLFILIALGYAVYKRQWKFFALVIFMCLYLSIHMMRPNSHHRYTVPIAWIVQVMAAAGVYALWKMAGSIPKMPQAVKWILQGGIIIGAVVWVFRLFPMLSQIAPYYVKGRWLAQAAMLTIGLVFIVLCVGLWFQSRFRQFMPLLAVAAVSCVMVVSQHFTAAKIIDNGAYYLEFKALSDWYKEHSKPGEKLASRHAGTLRIINAKRAGDFVHSGRKLAAETMEEFIRKCYENDVTYVAVTSRGSAKTKRTLEKVLPLLYKRQSYGPLQYMGTIEAGGRWVNIFKLQPLPQPPD